MGIKTQGIRVMPNADGWLSREIDLPARYGRVTAEKGQRGSVGWWQVTTPDGSLGCLDPSVHTITEHEDGTITVEPSLNMSKRKPGGWHGWLRRGVFESV